MTTVDQVYSEILARAPEDKMAPRIDAVERVCDLLGNPQDACPVVHLTGTNGKTSTARMIDALLTEMDLRVGRFTSPHLTRVTERISLDGEPIDDDNFVRTYEDIAVYVAMVDGELRAANKPALTFFEVLTVMAFAAFADAPVDVVVLEVGLGGQWDATNVAQAKVAVVTTISLDHTEMLGDNYEAIAREKSGILTRDCNVVLGAQPLAADQVLRETARDLNCVVNVDGADFGVVDRVPAVGGQQLTIKGLAATYDEIYLPLHGEHQAHNLALAIAAVESFIGDGQRPLTAEVLTGAMGRITSPGRLERVRTSPTIVVDAAHNPGGIEALVDTISDTFDFNPLVVIFGALRGKDVGSMLELLEPDVDEIVLTASASPRAIAPDELAIMANEIFGEDRVHVVPKLDDAIQRATNLADAGGEPGGGILATGSVTIAADVRMLLGAT